MMLPPTYALVEKAQRETVNAINALMATLRDADQATIYEGLPHPYHQEALLKDEIARKKNIVIQGFHFYLPAVALSEAERLEIASILQDGSWFVPPTIPPVGMGMAHSRKKCGGFHPDFQLEWKCKGELIQVQFCFGCDEFKIFGGKEPVYWDLKRDDKIKNWLLKFRKLCPKPRIPFFLDDETSARQLPQLQSLLKRYAQADAEVWEALPSPLWRDLREAESKTKANVDIHGYLYYQEAQKMAAPQRDAFFCVVNREGALRPTTNDPVSTFPHGGYLIRLKLPEGELDLQVALERGDIHYYWNDAYGYAPMTKEALEEVKKVLAEFRKQRPARGPVKDAAAEPAK